MRGFVSRSVNVAGVLALALGLGVFGLPGSGLLPGENGAWAAALAARTPLTMEGQSDFYKRVLTLPGARLLAEPRDGARVVKDTVPVFSVYYVFGRTVAGGTTWLEVGRAVDGRDTAWVKGVATQDWDMMLVMQFAAPGQRERVVFFKDAEPLNRIVEAPRPEQRMAALLGDITAGRQGPEVLGAEPPEEQGAVDGRKKPYLMPIFAYQRTSFDNEAMAQLLQVGCVRSQTENADQAAPPPDLSQQRIGIVFLLDTTLSMGPYIERTRQALKAIYAGLQAKGLLDRTTFGAVGYRNNGEGRPGVDYTARVFQPLRPGDSPETVLANLGRMQAATQATPSWDEDGLFGLHTALTSLDWTPFSTRIVIMVSDAGVLEAPNPLARLPQVGTLNLREAAERQKVVVFPLHLQTNEAQRAGDIDRARRQYRDLGQTGDAGVNKYTPIPAGSETVFAEQLARISTRLVEAIDTISQGKPLDRPSLDPKTPDLSDLLVNEMFGAQQRFIGDRRGTGAPAFFNAWAVDRDVKDPKLRAALDVKVYLTRNQLNTLAQSLTRLLEAAKASQLSPDLFFDKLRLLSAATAADPDRRLPEDVAAAKILPAYLRLLPYHSRVLALSQTAWLDMGFTGQQDFIDTLETKRQAYAELNASDAWIDLGAGDEGLKVTLMSMDLLP